MPFTDQSFDALVCQFGIMFFPDKEKSYREAYRVLSPGGHYFFSVWDAHRFNPAQRREHEVLGELFPTTLHPSMRCRSPITASIPSERR